MKTEKWRKPLVSIIMPVHNAGSFVAEAIESILGQSFTDFELIIINDISSDDSMRVIRQYAGKDKRIRIIHNKKNVQIAASLNKGIKAAKAEYLARMDADDVAHPNRISLQYKVLKSHKNVAVVGANIRIINTKGKQISKREFPTKSEDLRNVMFRYSPFAHPVVMLRKSAVVHFGGYDESKVPCEDIDLWFRLGTKYQFASIGKYLLNYRLVPTSNSNNWLRGIELLGFSIKWHAIRKHGYTIRLVDMLYNIAEFISMWFMPPRFRVNAYNALRSRNLI